MHIQWKKFKFILSKAGGAHIVWRDEVHAFSEEGAMRLLKKVMPEDLYKQWQDENSDLQLATV